MSQTPLEIATAMVTAAAGNDMLTVTNMMNDCGFVELAEVLSCALGMAVGFGLLLAEATDTTLNALIQKFALSVAEQA